MSLALKITRNPCCRQVLLPRSSTLGKITRRNLATSYNHQLLGPSHHHASLPALKPKPKSDALMYGAFAAAVVGIPCALLYSVREPYSLSWTQLVTNYGIVLVEFVSPSTFGMYHANISSNMQLGKEGNRLSFSFQKRDRKLDSEKWFANDSSRLL